MVIRTNIVGATNYFTYSRTMARSPHDPRSTDVLDNLVQVSFAVTALLSKAAAAHDLSLTQLRVLAILRDREPQMAQLAQHLGLERSSVSGLVERAVRRGLVRRVTSQQDGRAVHVGLTDDGRRLAEALTEQVSELVAPMTHRLSATDQERLADLLGQVLA